MLHLDAADPSSEHSLLGLFETFLPDIVGRGKILASEILNRKVRFEYSKCFNFFAFSFQRFAMCCGLWIKARRFGEEKHRLRACDFKGEAPY